MLIVDLGFSSAKWLYGEIKETVRSCFRKSRSDVEGYLYRGDRHLVGERALLETGSRYLRTVEELVDQYHLFVSVCAHKAAYVRTAWQSSVDLINTGKERFAKDELD